MNALTGAGHDPVRLHGDCAVDFTEHLNDSIEGKRVGIIPAFMEAEGLTRSQGRCSARRQELQTRAPSWSSRPRAPGRRHRRLLRRPGRAFLTARFDGIRYGYQEEGCANLSDQSSLSRAHGFGAEAKRRQVLGATC